MAWRKPVVDIGKTSEKENHTIWRVLFCNFKQLVDGPLSEIPLHLSTRGRCWWHVWMLFLYLVEFEWGKWLGFRTNFEGLKMDPWGGSVFEFCQACLRGLGNMFFNRIGVQKWTLPSSKTGPPHGPILKPWRCAHKPSHLRRSISTTWRKSTQACTTSGHMFKSKTRTHRMVWFSLVTCLLNIQRGFPPSRSKKVLFVSCALALASFPIWLHLDALLLHLWG